MFDCYGDVWSFIVFRVSCVGRGVKYAISYQKID
jgi:hypothetical protein